MDCVKVGGEYQQVTPCLGMGLWDSSMLWQLILEIAVGTMVKWLINGLLYLSFLVFQSRLHSVRWI